MTSEGTEILRDGGGGGGGGGGGFDISSLSNEMAGELITAVHHLPKLKKIMMSRHLAATTATFSRVLSNNQEESYHRRSSRRGGWLFNWCWHYCQ